MNNLKIGDKCICIRSVLGNEGKIAEVTGYFTETVKLDNIIWKFDTHVSTCDIIVTSLGGLLGVSFNNGNFIEGVKSRPVTSKNWRKLEDLDEEFDEFNDIKIEENV